MKLKILYIAVLQIVATNVLAASSEFVAPKLSPSAKISLLTCSPSDDDVYTLYGHTAIRVCDTALRLDVAFNYGIFDFSKPNFIYRFAKGETDYMLRAYDFKSFLYEYIQRGSEVTEQVLNLSPSESEALWQALALNERPENRVYRYNFFFDNCATRPEAIIEKYVVGGIRFAPDTTVLTFRDIINYCTRNHPWVTFGCDLVLGQPTDRIMTFREKFFLPEFLKDAFETAQRGDMGDCFVPRNDVNNDTPRNDKLTRETIILNEAEKTEAEKDKEYKTFTALLTSPIVCTSLFLIIILIITLVEWNRKKYYAFVDCALFTVAGLAGCVLFFLSFISVHPSIFPNISVLWLHPFHFIGVCFFAVKKLKKQANWYHFINFAVIIAMSVTWIFFPQHFNIAFAPLIASLLLRSGKRIKLK